MTFDQYSHTSANQITFKTYYIIHLFFVDNRIVLKGNLA